MPTAARLVSSIMMALSAGLVLYVSTIVYPDIARRATGLIAAAVIVGLINGWMGLGKRIALDEGSAIMAGLKAGVAVFVWVLLVYGIEGMIQGIMQQAYYQPMSALLQIPARMIQFGKMAMATPILGSMVVLSALVGILAKGASRRWS